MSCGTPSYSSSSRTALPISSLSWPSESEEAPRSPSPTSSIRTPWSPSETICCSFGPMMASDTARSALSTMYVSGVTWPLTTASPRPKLALMTISLRSPVAGLAVKMMPATSDGTITCTTTPIATALCAMPFWWR